MKRRPTIKVSPKEERTRDGILFGSKKEMRRYNELVLLKRNGVVDYFLRQVPFHLPGNTRYTCDFFVAWKDPNYAPDATKLHRGFISIEDVKGWRTPAYKRAKRQVEGSYPIRITEL